MAPPPAGPEPDVLEQLRFGVKLMALRALRDLEAAEEAAQETLVRALEAMRDGRPRDPEKLGAFVRGIARHVIADAQRASQRSVPLQEPQQHKLGTHHDDPLTALITAEERDRVRLALTHLSAGDREVLHLSFFDGLSPMEIAERLGEPASRIRKRKSRALSRLRQAFLQGAGTCHESRSSQTNK
ncbi:MAG: sigma-70 family RNA polymerase sigma factor [Dehalococcoidia bacterium]